VRTYHESQGKPIYHIRETKNFDQPEESLPRADNEAVKAPASKA